MIRTIGGTVYLERSDEKGRHRYYSATALGRRVIYRWGRIGYPGDELIIDCQSAKEARSLLAAKIEEKRRRGYIEAEPGGTRPRPVAGRPVSRTLPLPLPEPESKAR